MLLRTSVSAIDEAPVPARQGYEQVDADSIAMIRWLNANRVDYVLVGVLARSIRGGAPAGSPASTWRAGAVDIAPAPYGRNLDRLARALWSVRARLRVDSPVLGAADQTVPIKVTAEKLTRPEFWTLRCGRYDLDIEGRPPGVRRYQELLYEASKCELAAGVFTQVASVEDVEHYTHLRRTGHPPEIRVTRAVRS